MKILVVDDEPNLRNTLVKFLVIENNVAVGAVDGLDAIEKLKSDSFDIIMTDLKMPRMNGMQLIMKITEMGIRTPVIMMSAFGETRDAVNAMKLGAKDYIVKPLDLDEVLIRLKKICDTFNLENTANATKSTMEESFIGESKAIKDIKATVMKVSDSTSNVLITGESGTGKEVLARYIHKNSIVSTGPFMSINIAGIPDNLIDSELFGYEKGAFTGANTRKLGLFELAQGGTIFLDEIGDASSNIQVKLLRVLQEKKIMRLAGSSEIPINVRFIAATNRVLEDCVREGRFREDLYFRLNVIKIDLPRLNDRMEDLPLLAQYMIKKFNKKMGKSVKELHPDTLKKLYEHNFLGNIRELENLLERAMIFSNGDYLMPDSISFSSLVNQVERKPVQTQQAGTQSSYSQAASPSSDGHTLKNVERDTIKAALERNANNRTKTAEELGISRRTLINKIEEYGL